MTTVTHAPHTTFIECEYYRLCSSDTAPINDIELINNSFISSYIRFCGALALGVILCSCYHTRIGNDFNFDFSVINAKVNNINNINTIYHHAPPIFLSGKLVGNKSEGRLLDHTLKCGSNGINGINEINSITMS